MSVTRPHADRLGASGAKGRYLAYGSNGVAEWHDAGWAGPIGIQFSFSTNVADVDPGNGRLRLNAASQSTSSKAIADWHDRYYALVQPLLDLISSGMYCRIQHIADPTKWLVFSISGATHHSSHTDISFSSNISASSNTPFQEGDPVVFTVDMGGGGGGGGGATDLDDLTDVTISSATDAQHLRYNAGTGQWENTSLIWKPLMTSAPTVVTTNGLPLYVPLVTVAGEAIMTEF